MTMPPECFAADHAGHDNPSLPARMRQSVDRYKKESDKLQAEWQSLNQIADPQRRKVRETQIKCARRMLKIKMDQMGECVRTMRGAQ